MNDFGYQYSEEVYRAACGQLKIAIQINPNITDYKEYVLWCQWYKWDEGVIYTNTNFDEVVIVADNLLKSIGGRI